MTKQCHMSAAHPERSHLSDHNSTQVASTSGQCASHPLPQSRFPGLALVGNPGVGKSTILNGFADRSIFKAGISLNSGMTTSLSEYQCEGISLYDTPGLSDVEFRKKAGQELDKLLALDIPLKVAFVVTLESGRVRPDDSLTIELVLDAIKQDTNNRFGVIINQISKRVRETIMKSPEEEAKIRRSLTGKHSTSYWSYVDMDVDLMDASDMKLMTNDLMHFFCFLPETKERHVHTVSIDTESVEDKQEKQRALIREIEATNAEMLRKMVDQMNTQKSQYAAQCADLSEKLQRTQADNARSRSNSQKAGNSQANRVPPPMKVQNRNHPRLPMSAAVGPGVAAALGIAAAPAIITPSLAHAYKVMDDTRNGNQPTELQNGETTTEKAPLGLDRNEHVYGDLGVETEPHGETLDMYAIDNIGEANIDMYDTAGEQYNAEYTDVTNLTDVGGNAGFGMGGE